MLVSLLFSGTVFGASQQMIYLSQNNGTSGLPCMVIKFESERTLYYQIYESVGSHFPAPFNSIKWPSPFYDIRPESGVIYHTTSITGAQEKSLCGSKPTFLPEGNVGHRITCGNYSVNTSGVDQLSSIEILEGTDTIFKCDNLYLVPSDEN
jgi:hypothetical protein